MMGIGFKGIFRATVGATKLDLDDVRVGGIVLHGAQVVVEGSKAPTFTVFRLNDPDRLVVDLSQADGEQIKGRKDGAGPVMGVVASQFKDDRSNVSRLLVTLDKNAKYDVRADGKVLCGPCVARTATPLSVADLPPSVNGGGS